MRSRRLLFVLPLLLLVVTGCERRLPANMRGSELPEPIAKPDVVLLDTAGKDFRFRADTAGKLTLLFFGYTHCPDVCPMHMANIAAVLRDMSFADRNKVQVLFVTVDPQRDTPERVRTWLDKFDKTFIGLREKHPGDLTTMNRALFLPPAVTYPAEKGSEYTVGHASQVIAFTPDGVARYVYPFGTRQEDWAHDLKHLVGVAPNKSGASPQGAPGAAANGSRLHIAQVLIPQPPAETAALYAVIHNGGEDDTLVALTVPNVKMAALHEQVVTGSGGMAMRHVEKIAVPKGTTKLAPGGFHGMLMGLTQPYAKGDTVPVVFEFKNAGRVSATAKVVGYEEVEAAIGPASPKEK